MKAFGRPLLCVTGSSFQHQENRKCLCWWRTRAEFTKRGGILIFFITEGQEAVEFHIRSFRYSRDTTLSILRLQWLGGKPSFHDRSTFWHREYPSRDCARMRSLKAVQKFPTRYLVHSIYGSGIVPSPNHKFRVHMKLDKRNYEDAKALWMNRYR
ncbi:hypothetical protein BDP27DRAFT_397837 [Rhodocollybia butyracea]|uniref:Uncharacterized protein n=1 Tax=Rhodocollybia butyracea TaxID=206335 RepID=A0A9P5Q202_9AGAR|nr:hypothetical protein BDP27DRAFT_397837 [Rhodocollybia butyracea]